MKEFVITTQIKSLSACIDRITKTIMAEGKEETLKMFYEPYNDLKLGKYSREEIEFKFIKEMTDENRNNFYK